MFSLQTASPRRSCPSKRPSVCSRPGPNARRRPPRSFPLKPHGQPTGNPLGSERARCSSLHRRHPGDGPSRLRPAHPAPLTSLRPAEPRVRSVSRTRPCAKPQRLRVTPRSRPQARLPFPPVPCAPARARRHTRAAVAFAWNAGSKSLARRLPARAPPPGRPPHRLPCRRQGRLSPTRSRPHQCWDTVAA